MTGTPLRSDAETAAMLRADLADAEAQLARWPKCPAGCNCRIGIPEDADANECGCDGPCNGERPAPDLTALRAAEGAQRPPGVPDLDVIGATAMREAASRELAAAMAETRKVQGIVCKLLDLFGAPDGRLVQQASVTRATLRRYASEAGVRLDGRPS